MVVTGQGCRVVPISSRPARAERAWQGTPADPDTRPRRRAAAGRPSPRPDDV